MILKISHNNAFHYFETKQITHDPVHTCIHSEPPIDLSGQRVVPEGADEVSSQSIHFMDGDVQRTIFYDEFGYILNDNGQTIDKI